MPGELRTSARPPIDVHAGGDRFGDPVSLGDGRRIEPGAVIADGDEQLAGVVGLGEHDDVFGGRVFEGVGDRLADGTGE